MKDIEQVIDALRGALPHIKIDQLQSRLPSDDNGLWFITHPDSSVEVNIESSRGELPFLIENSANDARLRTGSLEETVATVCAALGLVLNGAGDSHSIVLEEGNLRAWVEEESIHIIAGEGSSGDAVELSTASARRLADALLKMAGRDPRLTANIFAADQ